VKPAEETRVGAREVALVALGAIAFAIVMNWPLILNLGETIPLDLGDPMPQAWQVAWGGHALAHQPLHFFDANQYWPFSQTLAFSDALIGYAPAGLIGSGPYTAVVRSDLLFLFAYALAGFGAYLLARELGLGRTASVVAGVAFAFAPSRIEQDGHLQVISSGGIPLALALGVRAIRLRSPLAMLAAWLVALWQVSLGFSLGLPFGYLLFLLVVIAVVVWLRRGRPPVDRRLFAAAAVGGLVFAIGTGLLSIPYQHVADRFPQATRSPEVVAGYSGQPEAFIAASEENLIWGPITAAFRDDLSSIPEQTLFPGLLAVCLAIAGATWRGWPRGLRIGLGMAVIGVSVLALGFEPEGGLLWPDRILYDLLPGWHGIRTPGRLVTFSSLALALLAAAGTQRLLIALAGRRVRAATASAVAAGLALVIAIEGRGLPFDPTDSMAQPVMPEAPPVAAGPAPQLHLPALRPEDNRRYLLWSSAGFPKMINGRSSTIPEFTTHLIDSMDDFPSRATVDRLRRVGVNSVIIHLDRVRGTPQEGSSQRSIAGLGLTRTRQGPLEVYDVRSPSARRDSGERVASSGRERRKRS
jgi:hypothetical protein